MASNPSLLRRHYHTAHSNTSLLSETVSPNILPTHVSPLADSLIRESSQSCHLWGASPEWCWRLFWRRGNFFFPSWGILFGKEKRKVQIKSEGWWLHITELLLQGMEELYSIYHIALGCAYSNIVMLMLQLISMPRHCGIGPLSQWILNKTLSEWIFSGHF